MPESVPSGGEGTGFVTIARIIRPRGNRGEVAADDLSDSLERFETTREVLLVGSVGERREAVIEKTWRHKGRVILKLAGVDSISDAEALRGYEVQIPEADLAALPDGEYFLGDLVGCEVVEEEGGRTIGEVTNVLEPGGPLLLEVRSGEREVLVPLVDEICRDVDVEGRKIRVRLPEGLEDLNP